MRYRLLSFTSLISALVLSLIFVRASTASEIDRIGPILSILAGYITQGVTILTILLLLTSLCISNNRLLRGRSFWRAIRYFFTSAIAIYSLSQTIAFLISKLPFLPGDQVPDISHIHNSLSVFGLNAETWEQIQNIQGFFSWAFTFSQLNNNHYIIWIATASVVAFVMLHDMEVAEPTYNLTDSISRLSFRLLQNLSALLTIYLAIYTIYIVWQIRSNALLGFYMGFFVRLIVVTILLFMLAPLFLFFVYKDRNSPKFFWQSFLNIFTSFLTGNAMFSMGVLIVEQKNHLAMPRDTSGILNPLNLLLLRPGAAIVLAYSFITYYSSNTRWQLNFFPEVFWLVIIPIGFAIVIGLFSITNYFMVLPFYFVLFGLGTTDTFVIMTPVLLLGQSFANCIDLLSWNLSNYIYDRFHNQATE